MAIYSTEAFVLRTYSLAEADKICVFLTREMGKVRGVAHGARKPAGDLAVDRRLKGSRTKEER